MGRGARAPGGGTRPGGGVSSKSEFLVKLLEGPREGLVRVPTGSTPSSNHQPPLPPLPALGEDPRVPALPPAPAQDGSVRLLPRPPRSWQGKCGGTPGRRRPQACQAAALAGGRGMSGSGWASQGLSRAVTRPSGRAPAGPGPGVPPVPIPQSSPAGPAEPRPWHRRPQAAAAGSLCQPAGASKGPGSWARPAWHPQHMPCEPGTRATRREDSGATHRCAGPTAGFVFPRVVHVPTGLGARYNYSSRGWEKSARGRDNQRARCPPAPWLGQ